MPTQFPCGLEPRKVPEAYRLVFDGAPMLVLKASLSHWTRDVSYWRNKALA